MENILEKLESEGVVEKGMYKVAFKTANPKAYLVLKDDKYGVINSEGEVVIGCRYSCISCQSDGTYKAFRRVGKYIDTDNFDAEFNYV